MDVAEWTTREDWKNNTFKALTPLIDHDEREADAIYTLLRNAESPAEEDAAYEVARQYIARKKKLYERIVHFLDGLSTQLPSKVPPIPASSAGSGTFSAPSEE
jgi:hypothetical protein